MIGTVRGLRKSPKYRSPGETETVMDFIPDDSDQVITFRVPARLETLFGTIPTFPARVRIVNLGKTDAGWYDFRLFVSK